MARTEDGLKIVQPVPVDDERTPLLEDHPGAHNSLEAQADQEIREHDAGTTPVADEPTTGKLLATMVPLWMVTFFAAMGMHGEILWLSYSYSSC